VTPRSKPAETLLLYVLVLFSAVLTACPAYAARPDWVDASTLGWDPNDATLALQRAINSGAYTVYVPEMPSPWVIRPITLTWSDQTIVCDPNVMFLAKRGEFQGIHDSLFTASQKTNLTFQGNGATLRMWKEDYMDPALYTPSEWRMGLKFLSCSGVTVTDLTIEKTGGDAIFIGVDASPPYCDNVTIRNVVCDDNYRQGISVISARNLLIENCVFKNTSGTGPAAGVDLEPDDAGYYLENITVRNCTFENNEGPGMFAYLNLLDNTSPDVSVLFENCHVKSGDSFGMGVGGIRDAGPQGLIEFRNCTVDNTKLAGIYVYNKSRLGADILFNQCSLSNVAINEQNPIFIWLEPDYFLTQYQGGIEFQDCRVWDGRDRPCLVARSEQGDQTIHDLAGHVTAANLHGVSTSIGPSTSNVTLVVSASYPPLTFEPDTYALGELAGQDRWYSDSTAGDRSVVLGGGVEPSPPEGAQMAKLEKTAAGNTDAVTAKRSFVDPSSPLAGPFVIAVTAAFAGNMASLDTAGFNVAGQSDPLSMGPAFGYQAQPDGVYLYYQDGANVVLVDADPGTSGTVDPAQASTFYKFLAQVDPQSSTYSLHIFDMSGNLVAGTSGIAVQGSLTAFDSFTANLQASNANSLYTLYFDDVQFTIVSIPGDANRDGQVNAEDLQILEANMGAGPNATWEMGDFDGNGYVNSADRDILMQHYVTTYYQTDWDPPAWSENDWVKGKDGWWANTDTAIIKGTGWLMDPISDGQLCLHRAETSYPVDLTLFRGFPDPNDPSVVVTEPFEVSVYVAHRLDPQAGWQASGSIFLIDSNDWGEQYYNGIQVGFKKADDPNDLRMFAFAKQGASDTDILMDADPNTPGVVDPVSEGTWYKWVLIVHPDPITTTFDAHLYDLDGNLLDSQLDLTPRRPHTAFNMLYLRVWNEAPVQKDVRMYYEDLLLQPIQSAPLTCAQVGLAADLNHDCYVNWQDFSVFAGQWLQCNNPEDENCTPPQW